jgi:hypothetical protein
LGQGHQVFVRTFRRASSHSSLWLRPLALTQIPRMAVPAGVTWIHSMTMRRSLVLLVMLFAMFWQTVALARPGSTVNVMADLAHAALHWQGEAHHHHDDGTFHLDDSQASTFHVLSDHVTATTALLPAVAHHFPPNTSSRPGVLRDIRVPDPFLDGLLRPPRLRT